MSDFNEIIRAKDRWINNLLNAHDYLYRIACDTVGEEGLPAFVINADKPPTDAEITPIIDVRLENCLSFYMNADKEESDIEAQP